VCHFNNYIALYIYTHTIARTLMFCSWLDSTIDWRAKRKGSWRRSSERSDDCEKRASWASGNTAGSVRRPTAKAGISTATIGRSAPLASKPRASPTTLPSLSPTLLNKHPCPSASIIHSFIHSFISFIRWPVVLSTFNTFLNNCKVSSSSPLYI
jgi:hypothetical protein